MSFRQAHGQIDYQALSCQSLTRARLARNVALLADSYAPFCHSWLPIAPIRQEHS